MWWHMSWPPWSFCIIASFIFYSQILFHYVNTEHLISPFLSVSVWIVCTFLTPVNGADADICVQTLILVLPSILGCVYLGVEMLDHTAILTLKEMVEISTWLYSGKKFHWALCGFYTMSRDEGEAALCPLKGYR